LRRRGRHEQGDPPTDLPVGFEGSIATRLRLVVSCPDQPGIVAAASRFLFTSGANVVRSDQFSTDPEGGTFFLRMEFTLLPECRQRFSDQSDCASQNRSG
jgi:formyltetrahydrofolate deformylase